MAKNPITVEDQRIIDDFSSKMEAGLDALERAKQINIGDYLVLYLQDFDGTMRIQANSYGAPVKYKVVYTTKHGIPFVKRINKNGTPLGAIFSCIGNLDTDTYRYSGQKFEFELDPDYADSLILQDDYDPSKLHKSKKDIWKEVTEHNKKNKVNTHSMQNIANFFVTLNIGDTLWSSNSSYFMIRDKKQLSKAEAAKVVGQREPHLRVKGPFVTVLSVIDKKGKVFDITVDFFHYKALYKERPRSYKELKI